MPIDPKTPSFAGALLVGTCMAFAPSAFAADKSQYSLFNPTPRDQMRDFSPDRPGKAHGVTTIDAGHFQLEADIVAVEFDREDGTSSRSISTPVPVLRIGLTDRLEMQLSTSIFNEITEKTDGERSTSVHGYGDSVVAFKYSVFGNEGGDQAMVLVPSFKLPTADDDIGNDSVEYAFNVSYSRSLPSDWSMTIDPGFAVVRNDADDAYDMAYNLTGNVSHEVFVKGMTLVLELAADYQEGGSVAYTFDPSLQYVIRPNLQLDVGAYIGLNDAAPDFVPYTGIAARF